MGKKTTVIAGDRSAALRFVEEVRTLTEGGTIVTRVGPESMVGRVLDSLHCPILLLMMAMIQTSVIRLDSWTGLAAMILTLLAFAAADFLICRTVERIRLTDRWSDAMTSFLVRRGVENVEPGLVGKSPDGTLSQTTTYTVEGRKMVAVLTGAHDGSQTTINVGLASADQQEER